jgi:thiosulfate dehydrogenase
MNKRNNYTFSAIGAALAGAAVLSILMIEPALAKKPFTAAEIQDQRDALLAAVAKGDALWHSAKLGTNGLACANCHPDASAANPETWPKFQTNLGKVATLRDMINWCIRIPLDGKNIDPDGDDMIAMEAYATYMSRGIPLSPGKDYQSGADPVKSGPGYPTGDDGNL